MSVTLLPENLLFARGLIRLIAFDRLDTTEVVSSRARPILARRKSMFLYDASFLGAMEREHEKQF